MGGSPFLSLYADNAVRAHACAGGAAGAGIHILHLGGMVALGVDLIRKLDDALGAGADTKSAALAKVFFKSNFCQVNLSSYNFLLK